MFKEMTDAELLDFCEDNFCEYEVCQALNCGANCEDEDCPLSQLFERFKKNAVIVTDTNVGHKAEWVSVDERLPDNQTVCLVYSAKDYCGTDYYHNGFCVPYVTHWMPLPEAPKMKGGADKPKVTCLNCKHLMFSDMYGECNKQLRIVNPSDTCEYAEPKERGAEE